MWTHLFGRQGVAAFGVVLIASGVGCSVPPDQTLLNPAGPPEVLEVFVTESNQLTLAYRKEHPNAAQGQVYLPEWVDRDGIAGNQAIIEALSANAYQIQKIRIIVDELLAGNTLEQFVCGCDPNCDNGITASLDPIMCGDDPDTTERETGRFKDTDFDGVPDESVMLPDLVTIDCGGPAMSWVNTDGRNEGWYNPSGNQFPSADGLSTIWDSLGPAIVLTPDVLPTGTPCTISVANSVTDKEGNPIAAGEFPADIFTVELMELTSSSPRDAQGGVVTDLPAITATFNTSIDPASIVSAVRLEIVNGAMATTNTSIGAGGNTIEIQGPMACPLNGCQMFAGDNCTICNGAGEVPSPGPHTLMAGTSYRATVTTATTDTFGVFLPSTVIINFMTAP